MTAIPMSRCNFGIAIQKLRRKPTPQMLVVLTVFYKKALDKILGEMM